MIALKEVIHNQDEPNHSSSYKALLQKNVIEQGRANALDLLINGGSLESVLTKLAQGWEDSVQGLKCSILIADPGGTSLSPFIAPSLPEAFISQLYAYPIGPNAGACGAAAHLKRSYIISDISTHPNCQDMRDEALSFDLLACWSTPIVSPNGELFGTFAMYYNSIKEPDQSDLDALEYEAKIVSIVVERAQMLEQLKQSKDELEQRVATRTMELTESNLALKKALEQRNEVQTQLIEMESMAELGTMMSSLTHEINTPVGVAITAISHLRTIQSQSQESLNNQTLKRSDLVNFYRECEETSAIVERNLLRSTELIKTFKQLSVDQHSQEARPFNLCAYVDEVLLSLKPRLKRTRHKFCIDIDPDLVVVSNPGAISQLLINLVMNSATHGFKPESNGNIHIEAKVVHKENGQHLHLVYSDNGKGMSAHTIENIYKPFFTLARSTGGSGLGMHICYNIVVKAMKGQISCESELGKGVRFTIEFPIQHA